MEPIIFYHAYTLGVEPVTIGYFSTPDKAMEACTTWRQDEANWYKLRQIAISMRVLDNDFNEIIEIV
jgi:hypothetical protein